MKRALAALTLATVAACSGGQKSEPLRDTPAQPQLALPALDAGAEAGAKGSEDPALTSRESKNVARTLTRVSELRGIRATKAVPGVKLERTELVARVKEKALREYPADVLRREGQLLQLMGFAPASFDYLGEMMKLLEAQLEGFYEPKNGTMYLAAELKGKEAEATLAHELVHALQDQKWDLKERSTYRPGRGDEAMALAALAEGDATSVMIDYVFREQNKSALDVPEETLRTLMTSGVNMGDVQSVPRVLRSTLIAPYIEGLSFVHALRKKGGWAEVDRAWDHTPTTTEQILHVDKWLANEKPIAIATPSASALGQGFQKVDEDTYGELASALSFEEWMNESDARAAAAGWGGDRSATFAKGDEIAFVLHTRYDVGTGRQDAFAERAMTKIAAGLKKSFASPSQASSASGGAQATPTKPAFAENGAICFDRKAMGPLLFARKERDLVMIVGPAKPASGGWSSTSTCATVRKWADEVLAQR